MSQSQYNSLISSLLNQKCAFAKLRAKLEGGRKRMYQCCKKFRYLAHNCRNKKKEVKGKQISQNKFKVIVSRVMQYGVREEVKVERQEMVKEVKCFRY